MRKISHSIRRLSGSVFRGMTNYRIGPHRTTSHHVCKREIVISKALHILTIHCMINLPTVSSVYSEVYCRSGSRSGASRKSGGVERSSEQNNDGAERGAGLNYRNMLERRAAFLLLTLRSHVLVRGRSRPLSRAAVRFPAGADQIWLARRRADQNSAGGGAKLFRRRRRNSAPVRKCAHKGPNKVNNF